MDAERPGPRRSDGAGKSGDDAAREGEPPRRGTSHGVALALAIGLTLLLMVGRWSIVFWDGGGEPPTASGARASSEREVASLPEPVVAADRTLAEDPRSAAGDDSSPSDAARARWLVRVEVEEVVDVASGTTAPLAGAEIHLSLEVGATQVPLARLVADRAGGVVHDFSDALARLPEVGRGLASIAAMASAPLHRTRRASEAVRLEGGMVTLRLELPRGASVRGRVVDGEHASVAGARVSTLVVDGDLHQEGERTTDDGSFELSIQRAARWQVRASAAGVGSATSPFLNVEPTVDILLGELVLQGVGAVGGRVVDGRGDPVAEVVVEARRTDLGELVGVDDPMVVEPNGLPGGRGVSRSDGRFSIAGLAAGRFRLSTPDEPSTEEGRASLHELGDESAVLVVTRHRLRVIVQDGAGAPIAGASLFVHYGGDACSATTDARGTFLVYGQPGLRAVVSASVPRCTPAEGEHTFAEGHDDAELLLTLRPVGEERGGLLLAVEDDEGRPLRPATVTFRTSLGSLTEEWYHRPLPDAGRIESLAPGSYVVEVIAGEPFACAMPTSSLFFPATAEVVVRAGEIASATVRLRAGGRLRFTLRVPPGAATGRLAQAQLDHLPPLQGPPGLTVAYRLFDDGRVNFGAADFAPDVAYLSAPLLEPGVHRLRFTAPGFRAIEQSFTIRPGQITDVELSLTEE